MGNKDQLDTTLGFLPLEQKWMLVKNMFKKERE